MDQYHSDPTTLTLSAGECIDAAFVELSDIGIGHRLTGGADILLGVLSPQPLVRKAPHIIQLTRRQSLRRHRVLCYLSHIAAVDMLTLGHRQIDVVQYALRFIPGVQGFVW